MVMLEKDFYLVMHYWNAPSTGVLAVLICKINVIAQTINIYR